MNSAFASPLLVGNAAQAITLALPFVVVVVLWRRARAVAWPLLVAALASVPMVYAVAHLAGVVAIARTGGEERVVRDLWLYAWPSTARVIGSAQGLALLVAGAWVVPLWQKVGQRELGPGRASAATVTAMVLALSPHAWGACEERLWEDDERLRRPGMWTDLQSARTAPRWVRGMSAGDAGRVSIGRAPDAGSERAWACAINSEQHVACWYPERAAPIVQDMAPTVGVVDVSVGNSRACAVDTSGRPHCWYPDGQELPVPANTDLVALVTRGHNVCSQTADEHVVCWTYASNFGRVGALDPYDGPWMLAAEHVGGLALGLLGTCIAFTSGAVACASPVAAWGRERPTLAPVSLATSGIAAPGPFAASADRLCARDSTGVECLERGGERIERSTRPIADVVQIAVADDHVCARTRGGRLDCWGRDQWGQCDEGDVNDATWVAVTDGVTCTARTGGIECRGRGIRP
jgi:hypothetical protein